MVGFEYLQPKTVTEALGLLSQHRGEVRVIAGGQSLIPMLRGSLISPAFLIGLEDISELQRIQLLDGGLRIGAMVTHSEIAASNLVKERAPILVDAEGVVGSPAVRNLGTIGGNLCHNEVGADPPPALLALGTIVTISGSKGERRLPLDHFFKGFLETVLGEDEILTYIDIPVPPFDMASTYMKYNLRAVDKAIVGVGIVLRMDGNVCKEARVALGGVAPIPFRSKGAESALIGQKPTQLVIEQAAKAAMEEAHPMTDAHASADYRRKMTAVFTRRALAKALEKNN